MVLYLIFFVTCFAGCSDGIVRRPEDDGVRVMYENDKYRALRNSGLGTYMVAEKYVDADNVLQFRRIANRDKARAIFDELENEFNSYGPSEMYAKEKDAYGEHDLPSGIDYPKNENNS